MIFFSFKLQYDSLCFVLLMLRKYNKMGAHESKHRGKESKSLEAQKQKLLQHVLAVEKEIKESKENISGSSDNVNVEISEENKNEDEHRAFKPFQVQEVSWPDPDPIPNEAFIRVDDVTRLNKDTVNRIIFVRCLEDIQYGLYLARKNKLAVSIRGTKHSMGGHTIAKDGLLIDMAKMNKIDYDIDSESVTVGAGILWSDVVYHLNKFGKSPKTLQSYSTFSVGGSMSVNAHGITSDYCLHESIISFTLVKSDGKVVICKEKEKGESGELFKLALGGYGMFGVIAEVTMKVQANARLRMDMIQCNNDEFDDIYKRLINDPRVCVKLGRIDVTNGEDFQLFVFSKDVKKDMSVVSSLPLVPRSMSRMSQVLYKWLLPSVKSLRSAIEKSAYQALDWTDDNDLNQLIYESAEPLAKLYSPLHSIEDTFILQEYFVPSISLRAWTTRVKPIITKRYDQVTLLNLTIRFVNRDETTLLAYSQSEGGSFCFVLYYRVRKSVEADLELEKIHNELTEITLNLEGRFYLPYRHHYSDEQLKRSYPRIGEFFDQKVTHDPNGLFSSAWSEHYMKHANPAAFDLFNTEKKDDTSNTNESIDLVTLKENYSPRIVTNEKSNCYETMMNDFNLRTRFFESFLVQIFNLEDKNKLESIIAKAVWNPSNKCDNDIYRCLQADLSVSDGVLSQVSKAWKGLLQTKNQKSELLRETVNIIGKLGRLGKLRDYVSIGDTGKLVIPFLKSSVVKGRVWVVHDTLGDIPGAIERGSENEVGKFVHIDYQNPVKIDIPSCSADLITLNQGLHHQPQDKIMELLTEIYRILRPNGLFIVREHDAVPELYPMLYLAHSVFNAVTGVPLNDEMKEIRAFRPILEWREIIENAGFKDSLIYEMEKGDPTVDEMMCFMKGEFEEQATAANNEEQEDIVHPPNLISHASFEGIFPKEISNALDTIMTGGPNALLEISRNTIVRLKDIIECILANTETITSNLSSGQQFIVIQMVENLISPVQNILELLLPTFDDVKVKEANFELIPSELIILAKALVKKGKEGKPTPQEMMVISFILDANNFLSSFGNKKDHEEEEPAERPSLEKEEVSNQMKSLLRSHPYLQNVDRISEMLGLNNRLKMMIKGEFEDGVVTYSKLTEMILNYVDGESWEEMSGPLEQIIQQPKVNILSVDKLQDRDSPWWHTAMGFLGSPKVQFNSYVITFGSMAGVGKIIEMWKIAQKIRAQTSTAGDWTKDNKEYSLTEKSEEMLNSAMKVLSLDEDKDAALDSVIRCLKLAGVIEKNGKSAECTWFKLPEWLQVEMVHIFGNFMHHTPWYLFPFQEMLSVCRQGAITKI